MQFLKHREYARQPTRTGFFEALAFRAAEKSRPLLEGLTRGYVASHMSEAVAKEESGIRGLVSSAVRLLEEDSVGRSGDSYTRRHSMEVARFVYVMAREDQQNRVSGSEPPDPMLALAGGAAHDVGKLFLPTAIVDKELGVRLASFSLLGFKLVLFKDRRLTDEERRVLRKEHVTAGTDFVRLFGAGEHIKMMLDMVGLHHVMYNGMDSAVPSYPSLIQGSRLPFHARMAKAADFISAVRPRHYRMNGIKSLDDALAYAVTASGTELDPLAVCCFMTGFYDVPPDRAMAVISRLKHPLGQEGVSDLRGSRAYAMGTVLEDHEFREIIARKAVEKRAAYEKEIEGCAARFGLDPQSLRAN